MCRQGECLKIPIADTSPGPVFYWPAWSSFSTFASFSVVHWNRAHEVAFSRGKNSIQPHLIRPRGYSWIPSCVTIKYLECLLGIFIYNFAPRSLPFSGAKLQCLLDHSVCVLFNHWMNGAGRRRHARQTWGTDTHNRIPGPAINY